MDNPIEHRPHPEYVLGRGSSQDHIEGLKHAQPIQHIQRLSPPRSPARDDPAKAFQYKQFLDEQVAQKRRMQEQPPERPGNNSVIVGGASDYQQRLMKEIKQNELRASLEL